MKVGSYVNTMDRRYAVTSNQVSHSEERKP